MHICRSSAHGEDGRSLLLASVRRTQGILVPKSEEGKRVLRFVILWCIVRPAGDGDGDVPPHFLREVEHFFQIYKELEGKQGETLGWLARDPAEDAIRSAMASRPP